MGSILESTLWGKTALRLLLQCNELDSQHPAIMHMRHTERIASFKGSDGNYASTSLGKEAAAEFGSTLPKHREYRLFHTYVDRTRETAEEIRHGIVGSGGRAELCGKISSNPTLDREAFLRWIQSRKWFPEDGSYNHTCQWVAGLMPDKIQEPSMGFAQVVAEIMMSNLRGASLNAYHIYVSHDMWIQAMIFHWFGVPPQPGGLRFLDGFLMQPLDGGIRAWFGGHCDLYDYPPWWPKVA
jgi:hypothetical protein